MLLILSADEYDPSCVTFSAAVKNNILDDSLFIRLLYSTSDYTTNGLYLRNYTKEKLTYIEKDLLDAYKSSKTKTLSLAEHAAANSMLKVSGVWESATAIGLAYKFSHLF
jgi:hypothetical protein